MISLVIGGQSESGAPPMSIRPFILVSLMACGSAPPPVTATTPVSASTAAASFESVGGTAIALQSWRWQDIMQHMGELRDMNFTAIMLSPHTATCGGEWSEGYDPYDYNNFNSRFGSDSELSWLVGTAHWNGMQVYANMVMNHMCARADYAYPAFSWTDFHHRGSIENFDDPDQLFNGDLYGLHDLAQESDYVRGQLYGFLAKTNGLGIDGFRFDAAKHVPSWFWRDHVLPNTRQWGKYSFAEVYDGNLEHLAAFAALGTSVTDYNLYDAISRAFRFGGDLSALDGAGFAAVDGARALTFVENHDVAAPPNRLLAYAFLSAYPGYPMFANVSLGDRELSNLAWVHNHLASGAYFAHVTEHDVLVFEREGRLLAGLNQAGTRQNRWVHTGWSSRKLHDYTGHGDDVWTDNRGNVELSMPAGSYVMYAPD